MKFPQLIFILLSLNFCKSTTFDREHFIVYFQPYLSPEEFMDVHGEAYLIPLVNLISTKFSRVYLPPIVKSRYPTIERIPVLIANFNKNLSLTKSNELQQRPISVEIAFDFEDKEETIEFKTAVEIANKANAIYPGTVESLVLDPQSTNFSISDFAAFLSQQQRSSYKLGVCLHIGYATHNFSSDLIDVLKASEKLVLYHTPIRQDFDNGMEEYARVITKRFLKCKKNIKEVNPNLDVVLSTQWPEVDSSGKRNVSALVSFWKLMNEWAVDSDSEVILISVLDNPNQESPPYKMGWWRFKGHHGGPEDFEFEEKEIAMGEEENESGECKEKGSVSVIFTVLISSLITTALIGSGIFFLYKKLGMDNGVEKARFLKRYGPNRDSVNDQSFQLEQSYEDRTPIALQFDKN